VVIPNHINDIPQGKFRRQQFIEGLRAVDPKIALGKPSKIQVFFLRRDRGHPGPGELGNEGGCEVCSGGPSPGMRDEIYCHSKVWIVDDIAAKIGSANCNRRSYTNDSELDIIVIDGALNNGARTFARNLRLALWGEHLNMSANSDRLMDHMQALTFWNDRPRGARVRPYNHNIEIGIEGERNRLPWDDIDPEG
jgi:phosphatidylserine/phosphatidylglycerophosphate/cardiolipin synthase-like enzyme